MDITIIILHYMKEVLKDKKLYILSLLFAVLILLSWYSITSPVGIGYFIIIFLQSFLVHNYAILVISTLYYTKSPEEMGVELRKLPFSALFDKRVMGVSLGIVLGELIVGGVLGIILAFVQRFLGSFGTISLLIIFIYWLIGKEGKGLISSSFGESFRALISLLYDYRYWKKSFNGVYVNIFFFALFIFVFSAILISTIIKLFPFLPFTLLISGFYFASFSTFMGIAGYFANKSIEGEEL
ncbi:MAG: hypothetical protein C6I01_01365 [Epsilonproteobacteria bacterium]|nr:hypothetical protein [Campylobacterota bacterium]NPA89266.1 hypothetical protein [Campylobacterota bacterium]